MSSSIVKRTILATTSVWAVLLLFVFVQSAWNLPIGGMQPEASRLIVMMTLPFTVGLSVLAMAIAFLVAWLRGR